ncbi:MAG: Zn-ribbon domain-containing OB-fold protein [Myxococcota bacterium]
MSQRFFPDQMPPPMADSTTLPWWEAAALHRLVVQRCTECGQTRLPPAPVCAGCRSTGAEWQELSGRGEVYTFTIVHRPIAAGQTLPYVVAVVALEGAGGVRMLSNLVDVSPEAVAIGMPVEVVWEDMSADLAIPRFRPAAAPDPPA